jgi:hypothetical protein
MDITAVFAGALVATVVLLTVHYVRDEVRDRRAWRDEVRRRLGR